MAKKTLSEDENKTVITPFMEKHILVVSQVFPYPPHDGGRFDVYHRLKALDQQGYRVTLVAFYNPAFPLPEAEALESLCYRVLPVQYHRRKLSKLFHWKPYSIASREGCIESEKLSALPFHFIIAESHHVLTIARKLKDGLKIPKLYLRSHNNEPRFMLSLAQTSPAFSMKQIFFFIEALKYAVYERVLMRQIEKGDEILHISYDEYKEGKRKYPQITHQFLPAGIDLAAQQFYKPSDKKNVLFVGALFSPNNLQGLNWYVRHVHPQLVKTIPDYRLIIAGNTRGANLKTIQSLLDDHMTFHDTPEDLLPIYLNSQVFINPMQYGAGVKLKTIDAILMGLPVVTTSIGNEGTGLVADRHVSVCNTPTAFTEGIAALLADKKKREQLVWHAQSFLQEHYNQEKALACIL